MTVAVVIPYRDAGCGWRAPSLRTVQAHIERILPDAPIVVADAGGKMFNKSKSLNQAIAGLDVDVIVMCDADSLPVPDHLLKAIDLAASGLGLVLPFDRMIYAGADETRRIWRTGWNGFDPVHGQVWKLTRSMPLVGTCNVLSRQTWELAGGWPEEFEGWGNEDLVFADRCRKVASHRRLTGAVVHLWHPKKGDYYAPLTVTRNAARLKQSRGQGAPMSSRYLLLCAGPGKRWQGRPPLTDTPKHFAPLCGERLVDRLIRQIRERDPDPDIRVVVNDLNDNRYRLPGTRRVVAKKLEGLSGLKKVVDAQHVWNKSGRTVIIPGDVWLTTNAANKIMSYDAGEWALFGRPGGNKRFTGKKWTEAFACVFWPHEHDLIVGGVERSIRAQMAAHGRIKNPHSWSPWWRAMQPEIPDHVLGDQLFWPADTERYGHYIPIIDASDDIDSPQEWERWCWGFSQASDAERKEFWL